MSVVIWGNEGLNRDFTISCMKEQDVETRRLTIKKRGVDNG